MNIEAHIVIPDTIKTTGLKHLLKRYFNIDAACDTSIHSIELHDSSAVFFTTSDIFSTHPDFFLPRRERTIVIAQYPSNAANVIDTHSDECDIIAKIGHILESIKVPDEEKATNPLSTREIDVLRLIAMGYLNKEIADALDISINTVLSHRKKITAKLGIKSASGLGFYAIMNGFVSESDIRQ